MEKNTKELITIQDEEIDINSAIRTLYRQKKLIILLTLAATFSSILYSFRVKPTWIGSFNIVVQNEDSTSNENLSGTISQITGRDFNVSNKNETERLILLSPSVLMPVFEKVNNYYKENDLKTFTSFKSWKNKELEVDFEKKTNILSVKHKNKDKKLILKTLNLVSKQYKDYSKRDTEKLIIKTINYLKAQKKIMEVKTIESKKKYNKFSIENGIGNLDGFIGLEDSSASGFFQNNDGRSRFNKILNNQNNNLINNSNNNNGMPTNPSAGIRFKKQFAQLEIYESQYVDLSTKLKPNSKTLQTLKLKIDNLRNSLRRPNEILVEYRNLYSEASRNESLLMDIDRNLEIMKLEKVKTPVAWQMISIPTIDTKPIYPKKINITLMTFFTSLLFSSIFVFFREKKSGYLWEFIDIEKNITCNYLENLFQYKPELNYQIINNIIKRDLEDNFKKINIGLFCFKNKDINIIKLEKNDKKYKIIDNPTLYDFDQYEKVLLIIQSGEITNKDIILLNKYISIYSNKLIGWTFIDSNLNL